MQKIVNVATVLVCYAHFAFAGQNILTPGNFDTEIRINDCDDPVAVEDGIDISSATDEDLLTVWTSADPLRAGDCLQIKFTEPQNIGSILLRPGATVQPIKIKGGPDLDKIVTYNDGTSIANRDTLYTDGIYNCAFIDTTTI